MPYALQCFHSYLYASIEECDNVSNQCIAPTARKTRCKWTISEDDLTEASKLRQQAQDLPDSQVRDEKIGNFLLLHCCDRCHRHKLKADDSGCLDELVKNYGAKMGMVIAKSADEEQSPEVQQAETVTALTTRSDKGAEDPNIGSQQTATGRKLRCRTIVTVTTKVPMMHDKKPDVFVRYKSDPRDSIRSALLIPVRKDCAEAGEVYSFTWPTHPEFVKIGYTKYSAVNRVDNWQICHPGATLSRSAFVAYPERVERLVHLQMAQHRRRISICKECCRSHEEWFERSIDEANQVISDWASLTRIKPLYGPSRELTAEWRGIINNFEGEITARALLDLLNAKAASEQEVIHVAVHQSEPSTSLLIRPTTEIALETVATAADITKQQDQMLTFFQDFMLLLAQGEILNVISLQPAAQDSPLIPIPTTTELAVNPPIFSAA